MPITEHEHGPDGKRPALTFTWVWMTVDLTAVHHRLAEDQASTVPKFESRIVWLNMCSG